MNIFKKTVKIIVIVFLTIIFMACPTGDNDSGDKFSITISNIPKDIPVQGKNDVNRTFKVWVNASDSATPDKPPVAQGYTLVSNDMLNNEKYTVTVFLKKPVFNTVSSAYSPGDKDWSGKAKYFSVMITPQDVSLDQMNAIWVKGGTTLNSSKANQDWLASESLSWLDFRREGGKFMGQDLIEKTEALYKDIILNDSDLTKPSQ